MRDDRNRVTVAAWKTLQKYIPVDSTNLTMTPTFGYIMDKFRTLYGIFISVTPITNDDKIIIRYRMEIFKLNGNDIKIHWSGEDQAFYLAFRRALDKAVDFIDD